MLDLRSVGNSTVAIQGHDTGQVTFYKYLGVYIDSEVNWLTHVASVFVRIHQRLHFLQRLRVFGVCGNIMLIFIKLPESIFYVMVLPAGLET